MCKHLLPATLLVALSSCAVIEPLLDTPVQVVDPASGETLHVPIGDVVADNAEPAANAVGSALSAINPVLGLMAAGAIGTLLAGTRRKKKVPPA